MRFVRQLQAAACAHPAGRSSPNLFRLTVVTSILAIQFGVLPRCKAVDSNDVDRAIEAGKAALLAAIRTNDEITWIVGNVMQRRTATGRVIRERGGTVELKTDSGEVINIPSSKIIVWNKRGFVNQEMTELHHGGPTALAAFALLSANVELSDERMSMMIQGLVDHALPEAGTYVRSLRVGVWAKLLHAPRITNEQRVRFKRLLYKDVQRLQSEIKPDGAFDYGHDISVNPGSGDASNTQFGNLGLWLGDLSGGEVSRETWSKVERYWMKGQGPGGGWSYIAGSNQPTSSMTVAGCNSLYIVLERVYARGDRPYHRYTGCKPNRKVRKRVAEIFQAIHDGDTFLTANPPDVEQHQRYELFGIERLGLASGRAEIGGQDWFRTYATSAVSHRWGQDVIADAFTLIYLVHAQAPVLFQKLEHGKDEDAWNFYFRDLHGLCIYLSNSFERLYRWQIVPADADLRTLQNAPILMISGHEKLELSTTMQRRLRSYIDQGGMVFLHADHGSRAFSNSAKALFQSLFKREGFEFRRLPEDHPLYTCLHGKDNHRKRVPLEAIADGPRILVLLSPFDLAGAWHQQRDNFRDIFEIMANIRVYCAPSHEKLPLVLRPNKTPPPAPAKRGELTVKRFRHRGDWNAHLGIWTRQADKIRRATGIEIKADEAGDTIDDLAKFDIVHMMTRGRLKPTDHEIDALKTYVKNGGFLLIESPDGTANGNRAVVKMIRLLNVGERSILSSNDALASGSFPFGVPLIKLTTTRFAVKLIRPGDAPPILLRTIDGRLAIAACPFDLSAGFEHQFVWNRVGFEPASTQKIVYNILNYRLAQIQGKLKRDEP